MFRKSIFALVLTLLVLGVLAVLPAAAQNGVSWTGQYYKDPNLSNEVFRRTDGAIAFDWGGGSPDSRIGNDGFSVRWGTDVPLPAGTYRFWALADDNIRIVVDFVSWRPVIDTFANPAVNQIVSGDVTLGDGTHHIQVDYREISGNARVYVAWANLATNPSGPNFPVAVQQPQPVPVGSGAWTAQYYANNSLSGSPFAIFSENSPDHNWGSSSPLGGFPADNFSVRWTSQQTLLGGRYLFRVNADDGVRVIVNGQTIINEWHGATGAVYQSEVNLNAGTNNIQIDYYEAGGNAYIDFDLLQVNTSQPIPPVSGPIPGGSLGGNWLASYYNNISLSGSPSAILTENSPSHNWGSGSPIASVLADNFSARWTSTQTLNAGTYQISVRADDGVRVYIDNVLWIDEWHDARGQTYSRPVTLAAGSHNFVIEYYERGGNAFIEFGVSAANNPAPQPQQPGQSNANGTLRVTATRLNVREQPTTTSSVIAKINFNESYAVVGCDARQVWWLIDLGGGRRGWVFGSFTDTSNARCVSGVQNPSNPVTSPTGYSVVATTTVNIRSQATTGSALLSKLPSGQAASVVGRNANATWWQINYNGVVGWVSAAFAQLQGGADLNRIPVTG